MLISLEGTGHNKNIGEAQVFVLASMGNLCWGYQN